jgi:hypothetical protein
MQLEFVFQALRGMQLAIGGVSLFVEEAIHLAAVLPQQLRVAADRNRRYETQAVFLRPGV